MIAVSVPPSTSRNDAGSKNAALPLPSEIAKPITTKVPSRPPSVEKSVFIGRISRQQIELRYTSGRVFSAPNPGVDVIAALRGWFRVLLAIVWLLAAAACTKTDDAWDTAVRIDTPDAYASFLERHPKSEYAEQARTRRDALIDERDWKTARRENTPSAYAKYLTAHPEGVWSELAARRKKELTPADETSLETLATPVPTSTDVTTVPPIESVTPKRLLQLGAFASEPSARKGWARLQSSFVELATLSPSISVDSKKGSTLHRLRVTVDSDEEADQLCAVLLRGGAECIKLDEP